MVGRKIRQRVRQYAGALETDAGVTGYEACPLGPVSAFLRQGYERVIRVGPALVGRPTQLGKLNQIGQGDEGASLVKAPVGVPVGIFWARRRTCP